MTKKNTEPTNTNITNTKTTDDGFTIVGGEMPGVDATVIRPAPWGDVNSFAMVNQAGEVGIDVIRLCMAGSKDFNAVRKVTLPLPNWAGPRPRADENGIVIGEQHFTPSFIEEGGLARSGTKMVGNAAMMGTRTGGKMPGSSVLFVFPSIRKEGAQPGRRQVVVRGMLGNLIGFINRMEDTITLVVFRMVEWAASDEKLVRSVFERTPGERNAKIPEFVNAELITCRTIVRKKVTGVTAPNPPDDLEGFVRRLVSKVMTVEEQPVNVEHYWLEKPEGVKKRAKYFEPSTPVPLNGEPTVRPDNVVNAINDMVSNFRGCAAAAAAAETGTKTIRAQSFPVAMKVIMAPFPADGGGIDIDAAFIIERGILGMEPDVVRTTFEDKFPDDMPAALHNNMSFKELVAEIEEWRHRIIQNIDKPYEFYLNSCLR